MSRISRTAVDGTLRVARLPLDVAITFLPVRRAPAKLAVDRVDANVRAVAASILGDETLREDAERRYAAAHARERSVELKDRAADVAEQADEQVDERHHQASRQRRAANSRARSRRDEAAKRQVQRTKRAAQVQRRRIQDSQEVEARVEQAIDEAAPRARLDALEGVAEAQRERDEALARKDEAERLQEAAARVKAERKQD